VTVNLGGGGTLNTFQTGGPSNQTNANFPTYIFTGGVINNGTMNTGPGQYVMAGTNSADVFANHSTVDGTSTAAQSTGSMFIFTDAAYPGMNVVNNPAATVSPQVQLAWQNLVTGANALKQGNVTADGSLEVYGLVNSTIAGSNVPAPMNQYSGITWWQDRRNSTVGYNEARGSTDCSAAGVTCTGDNGSVISCGIGCTYGSPSNTNVLSTLSHVTANSPGGVKFTNGNTKWALHGVYYQPRGAWIDLGNGNTGINCGAASCPLQVITGALFMGNGTTRMVLAGPTNPLISYKAVLIQ
jgi:hypothetical protein